MHTYFFTYAKSHFSEEILEKKEVILAVYKIHKKYIKIT